jgi:phenylacetate-CoA ligase
MAPGSAGYRPAFSPSNVRHWEPEFEGMPRDRLRSLQLRLFKEELDRVFHGNSFYQSLYRSAGFNPDDVQSLDDLWKVPVVRKDQFLADSQAHPPYGSRLQVPINEISQVVETSGTSGRGREVHALTAGDVDQIIRSKLFQFAWPGCVTGTVVALHYPISMASGPVWSLLALQRLGANVLRLGSLDADARLQYMRTYGVEFFQASPAYIMRLEYAADQMNLDLRRDLSNLRAICVSGGGWTVEWATECAERWGVRLFEVYANTQRAFTYTCEWGILHGTQPGVLHSLPHLGLLEVVDPETGRQVDSGEHGEVVMTPFQMKASPVVRFATGDRAIFREAGSCKCGRGFDGIQAGSVERYDDMLRIKEVNVWPQSIDQVVFSRPWVAEYRGELLVDEKGREQAIVMLEFHTDVGIDSRADHLRELSGALHESLGLHFSVEQWNGPPLRASDGGLDARTLKIRRWNDRRAPTSEES